MKITALTSCCVDHFPEENNFFVGGNSLNFATQCKSSGIADVSIIGGIGKDVFGDHILQHLKKSNIDRSRIYRMDDPTASNKIFIDKDGDRYFKADSWQGGAFDTFRLSDQDWDYVLECDIVAMPAGDPNLVELLRRRHQNQLVVIDFLDYFEVEDIARHIENIDIVFLSGKEEQLHALKALADSSHKTIVATLGAKGSIAFHQGQTYIQEAVPVDEVIDTTGCGDAFQAAFSIAWRQGSSIQSALKAGAKAARRVLGFIGGVK